MSARDQIQELRSRVGRSIIGQEHVVERLLIGLLANGNLLVEGHSGCRPTAWTCPQCPTTWRAT